MKSITLKELQDWKSTSAEFMLVDVREPYEHQHFNIGGHLMPLSELRSHIPTLNFSLPIIFYCQRGIRSQIAIQRLKALGYAGIFYNLTDGIASLQK